MNNTRIFCIAIAISFWPWLVFAKENMEKALIDGPAEVAVSLLVLLMLIGWTGCVAIAVFGRRP